MGLVRKSFTSHMAYSRERNVFLKLKGTGLGPELLTDFNGYLEYQVGEGDTLLARVQSSLGDPRALAHVFEAFCTWYNSYREKTNLALGDANPEKFVFTEGGLIYTDFETCKPGYAEQDLASMVGYFCERIKNETAAAEENGSPEAVVTLFICVCAGHISWRPDLLEKALRKELVQLDPKFTEYLVTYMTCCGVVISCGSGDAGPFASAVVANMPQRCLCVSGESQLSYPGFQRYICDSEAFAMCEAARQCNQPWMLFLSGDETGLNPDALMKMVCCGKNGIDAIFFNDYWDHVTPILIRTKAVLAYVKPEMKDDQICAALKREASVRLLISDKLFLEE